MRRIELAASASDDLDSIFLDGLDRFGYAQAQRFKDEIFRSFALLAGQPFLGEEISKIFPDARILRRPFPCKIIYRFDEGAVFILREYHGRQEHERVLG